MSVIIKGMEMPKDGGVLLWLSADETATEGWFERFGINWSGSEYKVIELPPHGRLIDADALNFSSMLDSIDQGIAEETVMDAPTIIEAEE